MIDALTEMLNDQKDNRCVTREYQNINIMSYGFVE